MHRLHSVVVGMLVVIACHSNPPNVSSMSVQSAPIAELPDSVDALRMTAGRLKHFATTQLPGSQPQIEIDVPAKTGCAKSVIPVTVTAMNGVGDLKFVTHQNTVGHVIAKIENYSGCTTAGIEIPSDSTAFWIVDHKTDGSLESRIVNILREGDVVGSPRSFVACGASHAKAGDLALFVPTADVCTHTPSDDMSVWARGQRGGPNALFAQFDDWELWVACGTDCCHAAAQ